MKQTIILLLYILLVIKSFSQSVNDNDGDGVLNTTDNCINNYNPSQVDADNDGIGDVCDCTPTISNPGGSLTPGITISSNYTAAYGEIFVCPGNFVTFTAVITNATTPYNLQWKKNGINVAGETNTTYISTSLTNYDIITCSFTTANGSCTVGNNLTSNPITVNVGDITAVLATGVNYTHPVSIGYTTRFTTEWAYPLIIGCRTISKIQPVLPNPLSGEVNVAINEKYGVDAIIGNSQPYVIRYWSISPVISQPSATSKVTLFFYNNDFVRYNNYVSTSFYKLPTVATGGSADPAVANLRVRRFDGYAPNTLHPTFFNFASVDINPADADVIYNPVTQLWEVTFDVTGHNSFFVYTPSSGTLPVSLTSFTAQKTTNGTVLKWETATESNNKGFDIEKSSDGTNFTKIGFVNGNNTSQDVQHYQYTDNTACTGRQLYRLKQIDNDNNFKYSSVATVNCGPVKNVTISPNPAASTITIVADNWVVAKLVNTNGQTVSTIRPAVSNTQQADVSKLPNGLYILQLIYKDGSMATEKIQVIQ